MITGRPWSPEDDALLEKHYSALPSMEEVAALLGRSESAIKKRACSLGLKRPSLAQPAMDRLTVALGDGLSTSGEIATRLGFSRHSVDALLKRAQKKGVCHIANYRQSETVGAQAALWVAGAGENALRPSEIARRARAARLELKQRKRVEKGQRPVRALEVVVQPCERKAFRDPFTAAFFGDAA